MHGKQTRLEEGKKRVKKQALFLEKKRTLTLLSPSHHASACSGVTKAKLGISLAAQSMVAAAMLDDKYSMKLASVIYISNDITKLSYMIMKPFEHYQ